MRVRVPESPVVTVPPANGLFMGMPSLEFFFFLMHVWEQEVASGTDAFEFRPVWGLWYFCWQSGSAGAWRGCRSLLTSPLPQAVSAGSSAACGVWDWHPCPHLLPSLTESCVLVSDTRCERRLSRAQGSSYHRLLGASVCVCDEHHMIDGLQLEATRGAVPSPVTKM